MKPWIFLRYLVLPAAVVIGCLLGEWWNFMVPAVCFVIHPLTGIITAKKGDTHQREDPDEHSVYTTTAYRFVALLFVPVLVITTGWAGYQAGMGELSLTAFTGLYFSTGIMNGIIGFTLAHEFIHRKNSLDRMAGHLLLLQNNYLHYSIEHIGGHHVYACTAKDPHTARRNESFYLFLPRALKNTFRNAWQIESNRLIKKQQSPAGSHNRVLVFLLVHFIAAVLVMLLAGWPVFIFLLLQSAVAVFLLHITNYLQHYGLLRIETQPGRPEKINTHHAWSSRKGKDGLNLFQLENHADHHIHPGRSYEQLQPHDDSPQMPAGYSGMIMLALIPPLWFRIMNKRIPSFITQNTEV